MRSMSHHHHHLRGRGWSNERVNRKKYEMPATQRPNGLVARGPKRLAGRFHQLRTGHCRTGQHLEWTKNTDTAESGGVNTRHRRGNICSSTARNGSRSKRPCGRMYERRRGKGKNWFTIRDLFADERCTSAILDFLRTAKVESRVGPRKPGEDTEEERSGGEVAKRTGRREGWRMDGSSRRRRGCLVCFFHSSFFHSFILSLSLSLYLFVTRSACIVLAPSFFLSRTFCGNGQAGAGGVATGCRWTERGRGGRRTGKDCI